MVRGVAVKTASVPSSFEAFDRFKKVGSDARLVGIGSIAFCEYQYEIRIGGQYGSPASQLTLLSTEAVQALDSLPVARSHCFSISRKSPSCLGHMLPGARSYGPGITFQAGAGDHVPLSLTCRPSHSQDCGVPKLSC